MNLFDRSGAEVGSVAGVGMFAFAWLDANRFVFIGADLTGQNASFTAFLGRVGSTQLTNLGQYENVVAGPSGSVALVHSFDPAQSASGILTPEQYVVLSADGR